MNTLLLEPTDVLFFRDGRPMSGASSGHGAAWPLPTVTDAALHAALHRSDLPGHSHRQSNRNSKGDKESSEERSRRFGSVTHAGPFPVSPEGAWYFPRPLDLLDTTTEPALTPLWEDVLSPPARNSLPGFLRPLGNRLPPNKSNPARAWLREDTYQHYLNGQSIKTEEDHQAALNDSDFSATQFTYGIGIDPETQTQDGERFYSAQYLRLKEGWKLGLVAHAQEKQQGRSESREDCIEALFPKKSSERPPSIIVGGQQRICTALRMPTGEDAANLPLPRGQLEGFQPLPDGRYAVKWVLLTPAIFPVLQADKRASAQAHPGGWLPSWIDPENGEAQLLDGPGRRKAKRLGLEEGKRIEAQLVAACTGRPLVVTGWALPHAEAGRDEGGAKPTLLAVPAGSVYYFAAADEAAAAKLAAALNWHQAKDFSRIANRRSTLLGEKGFGLGCCASWQPYEALKCSPSNIQPSNQL